MVRGSPEPALFGACGFENKVMPGAPVATFEMRNKLPAANVPDGKFRMRRIRFRNETCAIFNGTIEDIGFLKRVGFFTQHKFGRTCVVHCRGFGDLGGSRIAQGSSNNSDCGYKPFSAIQ